ncbi:MAG: 2-hydroxyacyl-CoA dehydratase [Peptoclostridium sp.]|uniref:double-cubane-cluster-containing anaerobic reductase n=1 Tax=Peptoclostridium sp. TaxID=1904860 RepID=UPI00139C6819|nr:double-cubane-cluster-containing anaerobic reductase [Peptoclostridium sp.]MZQ75876.1 2-hydroxyacyl-CoA dehydratase [Peptoclostridium sp.]
MEQDLFESFREMKEKNMMLLKEAKERGQKVVGLYCTYGPRELVLAAGAIGVGLCGTREEPIADAEKHLPRNLCPLIKSSYGYAVTDACPYFYFSDMVIGETTCDGKKKMFELMKEFKKVHVMNMPQNQESQSSLELMYAEMKRLKVALEEYLETSISDEDLRRAIHTVNEEKKALKRLYDLNRAKPAFISGMELLRVSWQIGFHSDREERVRLIHKLCGDILSEAAKGKHAVSEDAPRILLTGTPVGIGSEKVVAIVEESGGTVVNMESCGGYKTLGFYIDENDTRDPLLLLAEKYLKIPCSIMSPNDGRLELIKEIVKEFSIDGIIDLTWQGCHTYNIESNHVARLAKDKLGLPFLHLETDYSQNDAEMLRVRIGAFLEMMG